MDKKEIEEKVIDGFNFKGADLRGIDLRGAYLRYGYFEGTNFSGANLKGADIRNATLYEANFENADLSESNLSNSDLQFTNFSEAYLKSAKLSLAVARHAIFTGANLRYTETEELLLYGAKFKNTCLDPENTPNAPIEMSSGTGFRIRRSRCLGEFLNGRIYSADWFSTCPVTENHPGLRIWPTLEEAMDFTQRRYGKGQEYIEIKTNQSDCHKAGSKYRTRWFKVIGTV